MKAHRLGAAPLLAIAVLCLSASAFAAGTESGKFINGLAVLSNGTIGVTVKSPEASLGCTATLTALILPTNAERDRMYGMLVSAKTGNLPVTIAFDDACKITQVTL